MAWHLPVTQGRTAGILGMAALIGLSACAADPVTPVSLPVSSGPAPSAGNHWQPTATMPWHIQYQGDMGTPEVPVHNLDGVGTSASQVEELHAVGAHVVCYFNAGGSETFRDDYISFPDDVQGKPLDDWPGETWLDVRELDVLLPIMAARMDECAEKGFDAVDPDNLDGYTTATGFPLTEADALAYQRALIGMAHDRGLGIGLKNTMDLIPELADEIDFAVNEQCQQYNECDTYAPLIALDKPVFNVEYQGTCEGQPDGVSTVLADLPLDGPTTSCR